MRGSLTEDQMTEKASVLWECISDIPFSDDLALLQRYLGDIKGLSGADEKEAETYVKLVADLYEKLDEQSLEETLKQEKKDMAKSADEMAKEEEDKKKAASADADKEWDDLSKKIADHRAGGGKASDWKMGGAKDEDESEAKEKADKERVEETKEKEKAEAKDDDEAEKEKEKKEEKAKSEDGFSADAYGAPWSMRLGSFNPSGDDPASDLLGKLGYGPEKEKK